MDRIVNARFSETPIPFGAKASKSFLLIIPEVYIFGCMHLLSQTNFTRHKCVYWHTERLEWATDGCVLQHTHEPPLCKCNHLTSFALIVVSYCDLENYCTVSVRGTFNRKYVWQAVTS